MNTDPSGNFSLSSLNAGMNGFINFTRASLGHVGKMGKGSINCAKTLVQFSAGFTVAITAQANDAFLKGIKGSDTCGALAWMGAFYAADRMGLAMPLAAARQTPHFGSFDTFKDKVNMALFGTKSAPMKASKIHERYIEWHHVVEQELNRGRFKGRAIDSVGNLVPTFYVIHKSISGFYGAHQPWGGGKSQALRQWFADKTGNGYWNFKDQWQAGVQIWHRAHYGIIHWTPGDVK